MKGGERARTPKRRRRRRRRRRRNNMATMTCARWPAMWHDGLRVGRPACTPPCQAFPENECGAVR
uniref:Uncharacterized protein n=1 Tax=Arundo donax TaxID=35708 RepID=A0A0A8ZEV9_ARUDO